jgi:hypothetical protein
MSIDTRPNRPNKESSHAPETRDHSEHGRRKPGDSRFAVGSSGGYPTNHALYHETQKNFFETEAESFRDDDTPQGPDSEILADIFPSPEAGADGEGISSR